MISEDLQKVENESLEILKIKAAIYNVMIEMQTLESERQHLDDRMKILSKDLQERLAFEREQGKLKMISDASRAKVSPAQLNHALTGEEKEKVIAELKPVTEHVRKLSSRRKAKE